MSKYTSIALLFMSLFLIGCAKSTISNISFDGYTIHISSKTVIYEKYTGENTEKTNEMQGSEVQFNRIYQIFTSENNSGFINSVLIFRDPGDTKIPLAKIAEINIKKVQEKFKGFDPTASSETSFSCNENKIPAYLESFTANSINQDQILYINQLFFIDQGHLYVVSTSTENKINNKELKKALKNITCLK